MVELVSIILALSMEVMVDVILTQPLKATIREKTAWPHSHGFVAILKVARA